MSRNFENGFWWRKWKHFFVEVINYLKVSKQSHLQRHDLSTGAVSTFEAANSRPFFSVSRHYSDALSVRLLSLTMQTSIVTKMTSLLDMFDRSGHNATTLNLTWDILPDHFKNEYVEVALAKEPYSVFSNVLMTCFYVVILVFGMVGNFMTLIVISWEKGTKSPANLFLISLSLADIITLLIGNIFEFNFGNF